MNALLQRLKRIEAARPSADSVFLVRWATDEPVTCAQHGDMKIYRRADESLGEFGDRCIAEMRRLPDYATVSYLWLAGDPGGYATPS